MELNTERCRQCIYLFCFLFFLLRELSATATYFCVSSRTFSHTRGRGGRGSPLYMQFQGWIKNKFLVYSAEAKAAKLQSTKKKFWKEIIQKFWTYSFLLNGRQIFGAIKIITISPICKRGFISALLMCNRLHLCSFKACLTNLFFISRSFFFFFLALTPQE